MSNKYELYRAASPLVPGKTWTWNMYGPGLENLGRAGKPEQFPIPEPGSEEILVRVDAVGMCFSDVKLIQQGSRHPKLYNRNLAVEPTRLGHEVALTVVLVGEAMKGRYRSGQRLALQPDISRQGRSTAYGYTIPGGLTQYHLVGREVLDVEGTSYVLPLEEDLGYAETALTEPWACVEAAYTQRRRLAPKAGGMMWILGRPGNEAVYAFSMVLDAPATIVTTDLPASVVDSIRHVARTGNLRVLERDGVTPAGYAALAADITGGAGFDDIVILDPRSAAAVGEAARFATRRGTINLVGRHALDGPVLVDVGRIHYDYIAWMGTRSQDVSASYGEQRNRCELRAGGTAVFVGAGGPMGQMHVQRAIELPDGPSTIVAADINTARLAAVEAGFSEMARSRQRRLVLVRPETDGESLNESVMRLTGGRGADDVIVCVPSADVMADAAGLMACDGMLVLFAGVPNGTLAPFDLADVYLENAQFTGTSGSALADQSLVIRKTQARLLSPGRSVGAVGGLDAAVDGARAMMEGRYPGKVIIFPQLTNLPLRSLGEIAESFPDIGRHFGPGRTWTIEAEQALIERFWTP